MRRETTDLAGNILWLWGTDGTEREITLDYGTKLVRGAIRPNQQLEVQGSGFRELRQVAYDVH